MSNLNLIKGRILTGNTPWFRFLWSNDPDNPNEPIIPISSSDAMNIRNEQLALFRQMHQAKRLSNIL